MTTYTAHDILALGCEQGPQVPAVLAIVNAAPHTPAEVEAVIRDRASEPPLALLDEPAPPSSTVRGWNCLISGPSSIWNAALSA